MTYLVAPSFVIGVWMLNAHVVGCPIWPSDDIGSCVSLQSSPNESWNSKLEQNYDSILVNSVMLLYYYILIESFVASKSDSLLLEGLAVW